MTLPKAIRITEVGPRDGLQNEPQTVSVDDKVRFVDLLSQAGAAEIEVSSFVSPKWVPQLGDAAEVCARIKRRAGVVYSALVPNEKGLDAALAAGVDKVSVFTAASETFSRRNTNASIDETIERFRQVVQRAKEAKLPARGYVSCVVQCPYEGPIAPQQVRAVVAKLRDLGVDEIDLGETIGVAAPPEIEQLYAGLDGVVAPGETTLHMHDTRGTALTCIVKAMELGVTSFDASAGGIGGCPYAPGAAGNVATDDVAYLCQRMGIDTGVELARLFEADRHIAAVLGRGLRSAVFNADGADGR